MKSLLTLILVLVLIISPVHGAIDKTVSPLGKKISNDVYDLGTKNHNGKDVRGYMILTSDEQHLTLSTLATTSSACYSFTGSRWRTTEQYVLNTANTEGLSDFTVKTAIANSMNAWDYKVGFKLFGTRNTYSKVDGADTSGPDGKNEIYFGTISTSGVVATTIIWIQSSNNAIIEYDQVFDQADFNWGTGAYNKIDFQSIATHELGHAIGMKHPGSTCTEETMFASVKYGETKKRTLNSGDIAGITTLYK